MFGPSKELEINNRCEFIGSAFFHDSQSFVLQHANEFYLSPHNTIIFHLYRTFNSLSSASLSVSIS